MTKRSALQWTRGLIAFLVLALEGCASLARPELHAVPGGMESSSAESAKGWWSTRFVMNWPEGSEPLWHMDALLAHLVVSPVLERHGQDITLWRFHRRAVRDAAGHQFSFIFYATPETARQVFSALEADPVLADMKLAGFISRDFHDDTGTIARPAVEDTCDARWSDPVKKSWPYFIMGASRMWLSLIAENARALEDGSALSSPEELEALYRRINDAVDKAWQEEGQHALLHHLNALFGYRPMIVREQRLLNF